ncbi:MAG: 50S ribosomal protein L11 methyltransferase [Pseudomonadota bacterium]
MTEMKTTSGMRWVEFRVACGPGVREAVADFFMASLGASGVVFREEAVVAYFPEPEAEEKGRTLKEYLASVRAVFPAGEPVRLRRRLVAPKDWASGWKRRFKSLRIGQRLLVRPSWREKTRLRRGDVLIEIDPGQAFGTGAHASTALALEAIEKYSEIADKKAGLDVGTGTGILAIAMVRLGWPRVVAIDIDPETIDAARLNLERNGVADAVSLGLAAPEDVAEEDFGLVAANISRTEHLKMVADLTRLARKALILSGLLDEQVAEVEAAYLEAGFRLRERLQSGGWAALVLQAAGAQGGR